MLVKCYDHKMVEVTLQLGHLSIDSASGGSPTTKKDSMFEKRVAVAVAATVAVAAAVGIHEKTSTW